MEKTEKFFIFTWKELIVIILMVFTLLGFFFTLGLHYGKKINIPQQALTNEDGEKLEASPESLPPREALEDGSQHAKAVSADTLKEATKEELAKTGVKIDLPKAVALPAEKTEATEHAVEEKSETKSTSAFFVQLGSFVTKKEAQAKVKSYSKKGVETEIHSAVVNHQTRYRVVIAGFSTRASAEQQGKELKHKHKIDSFVVIK